VIASSSHRVIIASQLYNSARFIPPYFESIISQNYTNLKVVIYDDASEDESVDVVASYIGNVPFELVLLQGKERGGPALAKWHLIEHIRKTTSKMDLVMFLDADDKLFHPGVLKEVDETFRREKPWFAYGRIRGYFEEECGPPPSIELTQNGLSSTVRTSSWVYCHPRIFRAFLLEYMDEKDFKAPKGWLQKYTDRLMVYKALELSGDSKVTYMDGPKPHVYYRMTQASTTYIDKKQKAQDLQYVKSQRPLQTTASSQPIHIIMCTFAKIRMSHLDKVLSSNIEQQDVGDRPVYLHICNNGGIELEEPILEVLKEAKGLAGFRLRSFFDNPGGFARFYMMQDAIKEFPIDYFVILDDDVLLPPKSALAALMAEGKPQEYNSYWGRHFTPKSNYFYSALKTRDRNLGTGKVSKFHYAGTGVSVIDADIVRFYMPLLEKVGHVTKAIIVGAHII